MRVLMFGWEFPPHISGGLGTACYGMTRALLEKNTKVIFVLPCTRDNSTSEGGVRLAPASGTVITPKVYQQLEESAGHIWREHMHIQTVDSLLFPYDTPETYAQRLRWREETSPSVLHGKTEEQGISYTLKGGYGPDLMAEVYRFSRMSAVIALREEFDVIHVHDWMTYPAGMLARAVSGKPLVAHIHATEYDRSGKNVNPVLADMERAGLHAADLVIAVSHLTKNVIMEHYGIPEHKIHVVHNAVARHDVQHNYTIPPRLRHEKRVLFLGRVTFQKGPDYFIEAARMVLERVNNVR